MLIAKTGGGALITKKRKKAFTLIELLAIIVILAIIAVITVPIILNIIDNSKKGAATDSAYGYKDAVNKAYIQELAKPNNENLKLNGIYTVQNDGTLVPATGYTFGVTGYNSLPVSLSGDKPSSGSLTYSNNVLTSGCLVIGDYAITFDGNETSTAKGDCSSNSGSSSSEQGNSGSGQSGNQTPTNPYLTTFDGDYTYLYYDDNYEQIWGNSIPDESVYIRNDGTNKELCGVFGSGLAGTVCLTSSYYNSDYDESYSVDFKDVSDDVLDITTSSGLTATGLKGYALAKAQEMLSKGATSCNVESSSFVDCYSSSNGRFIINDSGKVQYGDDDHYVSYDGEAY